MSAFIKSCYYHVENVFKEKILYNRTTYMDVHVGDRFVFPGSGGDVGEVIFFYKSLRFTRLILLCGINKQKQRVIYCSPNIIKNNILK